MTFTEFYRYHVEGLAAIRLQEKAAAKLIDDGVERAQGFLEAASKE